MQSTLTQDQRCGLCRKMESARNEPPGDVKYGYCKPREQRERETRNGKTGRLIDVDTPCFMSWPDGTPAFEAKP